MSKPMLYHTIDSPPCWAVRMLAARIGLEMDTTHVDLLALEHRTPKHLEINPMGTVPTIVDGDFTLSDSHAIVMYLVKKYGGPHAQQLYPTDIRARARVDQAMYFDTGVAFIRFNSIAVPVLFGDLDTIDESLQHRVEDVYNTIERYLSKSKYIAGEHLTLGDITLGTSALALQTCHDIDGNRFPRALQWVNALKEDKQFKEIAIPGARILGTSIRSCMETNRINKHK